MIVNHNGARIAGEAAGAGDAVIFLHAGVCDRRMWRDQLPYVAGTHRAAAYDRRGFGETVCEDVPFSHVDDLAAVMDELGVSSATLVGCSQGGRIAIDFTLASPDRVRGLVLVASAVSGAPDGAPPPAAVLAREEALEAAEDAGDVDRVNAIEANLWLDGPAEPEGRVSGSIRELFLDMNGIALRHPELTGEREPPSAYERLGEIGCPALVAWGSLDYPEMVELGRHLAASIPHAEGVELDGVAHLPSLEQPARTTALIGELLSRTG